MQAEANTLLDVANAADESKKIRTKRKSDVIYTEGDQPRKRTKGKGKGKVGRLEGLMSVPMDILFEILGHLRPLDILHLARTTKEFRRILMHKSSTSVWKAARANVPELPDSFPGMDEPQFVNLAFDQHCHVCLASNIRSVDWPLRIRLCPKCTKTSLVVLSWGWWDEENQEDICEGFVPARETTRSRQVAFGQELHAIKEHWETLDSHDARDAYAKERKAYKAKVIEHADVCNKWFKLQQLDRSQELEQARQDRKRAIIEKLRDLGWGYEIDKIPSRDIGIHKLVKQPHRLTERIWKNIQPEMVKFMEEMKVKRLECERKALIISRKYPAIDVLCDYKKSQLPWTELMPEPVDFCNFPPVKAILELPNEIPVNVSKFAEVVPLLPSLFADWRATIRKQILLRFSRHLQEQQHRVRGGSISDVFAGISGAAGGVAVPFDNQLDEDPQLVRKIALATTVFKCRNCGSGGFIGRVPGFDSDEDGENNEGDLSDILDFTLGRSSDISEPLFYPKVMGHRCLTKKSSRVSNNIDPSTSLDEFYSQRAKWSCKNLRIDNKAGMMMEEIVKAYGLDPLIATVQDMDDLDAWLGCPHCADWRDPHTDNAKVRVFKWRAALKHHSRLHYNMTVSWLRLTEAQKTLAREAQNNENSSVDGYESDTSLLLAFYSTAGKWSCTHCLDRPCEKRPRYLLDLKAHLKSQHQVEEPKFNRDYYKGFDTPDTNDINRGYEDPTVNIPLARSKRKPGFSLSDFMF